MPGVSAPMDGEGRDAICGGEWSERSSGVPRQATTWATQNVVAVRPWVSTARPITKYSSLDYLTPNEFEDPHSPQPQATLS